MQGGYYEDYPPVHTYGDYSLENPSLQANAVLSDYYDQNWYLDSGASSHVIGHQGSLTLDNNTTRQNVSTADGASHQVAGIGTTTVSSKTGSINLNRVLYVPALSRNLISVGSLTDKGYIACFDEKKCFLINKGNKRTVARAKCEKGSGLYWLVAKQSTLELHQVEANLTAIALDLTRLWHHRLGHLNFQGLHLFSASDIVTGLPYLSILKETCSGC